MYSNLQLFPHPVISLITFVLYLLPVSIILWQPYNKAGRPGWQAIIPGYNNIIMAEIGKSPRWAGYVGAIASLLQFLQYFVTLQPSNSRGAVVTLLIFTTNIVALYLLVRLTRMYDRGIFFWLGVIFLPFIAVFFANRAHYTGETSGSSVPPTGQISHPVTPLPHPSAKR